MKDDEMEELLDRIEDTIEDALEDKLEDALEEALEDAFEDFKDDLADEIKDHIEETVEEAITDQISEFFTEALDDYFTDHQFVLKDGTIIQARPRTKVMSPDKKSLLICYGGLRVDGTTLVVQERVSSWRGLCSFATEEEAVEALKKVSAAIERGDSLIEL